MSEPPFDEVGPARKRFGALFTQYLLDNPVRPTIRYTNNAFALAIEMTPPTIGYWRKGTSLPETKERLEKILDLLFGDFPGHEEKKDGVRLAWRLAQQEPYPYRSRTSEETDKELEASPSSTDVEKPVGSANEQPDPKPLAAERYAHENLLDTETLRAANITGPAAPEAVEFFQKRNFRFRMPPFFMGREETLSAIETAFKTSNVALAITVLHGLRGVGKTTLAFAYAEHRADDYRTIWRISAQSEPTMRAELAALGANLGWVDKNEKEDAALAVVMDRLPEDGEGILLIYDNSIDAATLAPYLPKSGSARILITSTSPASGWRSIAKTVIDLQTWPTEVGAHFLVARSGRTGEGEAATALSEALGGLPLAHEMAAAYCEQCERPLAEYNTVFDAAPAKILDDSRFAPTEYGLTVAKAFALAIDQAAKREPAAALLIVHFAQLAPAPIPLFLFARTFGALGEPLTSMLDDDGLERTVAALRAFALIDREEILDQRDTSIATHAIRLHRLVREVAAARCSGGERDQIRQAFVKLMSILYPINPRSPVSWRNCALLTPHLLDICKTAVTEGCAALLNSVGLYYLGLQALSAAQPLFERALMIREQLLGPEDLLTGVSVTHLALLHHAKGELATAQQLYERALAINQKLGGPETEETATTLGNLGTLLLDRGDVALARPYLEQALAIRENVLGPEDDSIVTTLQNLGILFSYHKGDPKRARPFFERALAINEKTFGLDHPATAESLTRVGAVRCRMGDREGGRRLIERALQVRERWFGPEHPDTADSLEFLAQTLKSQGDRAWAQALCERALAINEKAFGPEHRATAISLRNLAEVLPKRGNYWRIFALNKRALAIHKKLGLKHPEVREIRQNLYTIYFGTGLGLILSGAFLGGEIWVVWWILSHAVNWIIGLLRSV